MNRKTFSNIFSMVVIAAAVFVFGNYNVKAHIHGDSSIAGKLNLHADNKLVLDKPGKNQLKELRLHDQQLLLLDKQGLKNDKIANPKKLDLLKYVELNVKPNLPLDDGGLFKLEKEIALAKDLKLADHKLDLSRLHKDNGLVDKIGLLSAHLKSGLVYRKALKDKRILDNKAAKFDKDELKLAGKYLIKFALGIDNVLEKKDFLKEEKTSVLDPGLDEPLKSGLSRNEKSILKIHSDDLKGLLDLHKLNKIGHDDSIVKDLGHSSTAGGANYISLNEDRYKTEHKGFLALKNLKIEESTHSSALPDQGGVELIPALRSELLIVSVANDLSGLALKKNKFRKEFVKNIEWQWTNNPISVLNAMKWWFTDKNAALQALKEGQANDRSAQTSYDAAAAELPDFWSLVFYTSSWNADFSVVEGYIKWQQQNEWNSLNTSRESWNALPRNEEWAYYNLLWGQRQNWEALGAYRAGWGKSKAQVMALVENIWRKQ